MITPQRTLARKPIKFQTEPASLAKLQSVPKESRKSAVKLASLIVWPGKPGYTPELAPTPLTAEEQARFNAGKSLFAGTCAACHQLHGRGMEGLAPPLADSEVGFGNRQTSHPNQKS